MKIERRTDKPKKKPVRNLAPRDGKKVVGGLEYKLDRCFVKSWSTSG